MSYSFSSVGSLDVVLQESQSIVDHAPPITICIGPDTTSQYSSLISFWSSSMRMSAKIHWFSSCLNVQSDIRESSTGTPFTVLLILARAYTVSSWSGSRGGWSSSKCIATQDPVLIPEASQHRVEYQGSVQDSDRGDYCKVQNRPMRWSSPEETVFGGDIYQARETWLFSCQGFPQKPAKYTAEQTLWMHRW